MVKDKFLSPEWIKKVKDTITKVDGEAQSNLTSTLMFSFFVHLKECSLCYNRYASIFDHIHESDKELLRKLENNE